MIYEGENGTNGCHLVGFSEDIAFAHHFVATCLTPTLPSYRSAPGIGYAPSIGYASKKAENSASYSPISWWIDKIINSYRIVANFIQISSGVAILGPTGALAPPPAFVAPPSRPFSLYHVIQLL